MGLKLLQIYNLSTLLHMLHIYVFVCACICKYWQYIYVCMYIIYDFMYIYVVYILQILCNQQHCLRRHDFVELHYNFKGDMREVTNFTCSHILCVDTCVIKYTYSIIYMCMYVYIYIWNWWDIHTYTQGLNASNSPDILQFFAIYIASVVEMICFVQFKLKCFAICMIQRDLIYTCIVLPGSAKETLQKCIFNKIK